MFHAKLPHGKSLMGRKYGDFGELFINAYNYNNLLADLLILQMFPCQMLKRLKSLKFFAKLSRYMAATP